jgi:2-phospho-L-lactate/phosphoenolpyruvate guanylyltransferase
MPPGLRGPNARAGLGLGPVAVLLPVKSFSEAKLRLAPALPPAARRALARDMATHVLACAGRLPVAVVCDDVEVAAWAREHHALVVWEPERGLNRAVEAGVERLASERVERVIVAHADLAFASALEWVGDFHGVTLVPDRGDNGTNVVGVPAGSGFAFSYGPGSFARHQAEARRLGLPLRVVRAPDLARDVDLPSDLAHS